MSLVETAKAHPVAAGTIAVAAVVILYLLFKGGSSTSTPSVSGTDVGAATDAYAAQQQAATQANQISASLQANSDNNAAAVHVADLQAALGSKQTDASETVALAQISAAQQYQSLATTLYNQTQQAGITADVNKTSIAANQATTTAQILASVLNTQTQAQVQVAQINNSTVQAQIAANAAVAANQCSGFFSCLFG